MFGNSILQACFRRLSRALLFAALPVLVTGVRADDPLLSGKFRWQVSEPLISPAVRAGDPCHAIKDPTVVFSGGKWHVFATIRSRTRTHQIEYLSFADWKDAEKAERHVLKLQPGYFCAPQVFWFTPHQRWYLIHQIAIESRKPALQAAWSSTEKLDDPRSWTPSAPLYESGPEGVNQWIDFWVICDAAKAHLFFTSPDGRMWRAETALADFPKKWTVPQVVLSGDIFEASHTYRIKGQDRYLTLVEAQDSGRRYYKAYAADRLDGDWKPLAATREMPFASALNCRFQGDAWTHSFSHGELLREGADEKLEIDPQKLRFLFQGVSDQNREGKDYGAIPWRLGLLTLEQAPSAGQ